MWSWSTYQSVVANRIWRLLALGFPPVVRAPWQLVQTSMVPHRHTIWLMENPCPNLHYCHHCRSQNGKIGASHSHKRQLPSWNNLSAEGLWWHDFRFGGISDRFRERKWKRTAACVFSLETELYDRVPWEMYLGFSSEYLNGIKPQMDPGPVFS